MATTTAGRIKNNYFDGLPVSRKQMFLFLIIILAYFFEQMDNGNFAFIAAALVKNGVFKQPDIGTIQSIFFVGMTLGGFLGGIISDLIGRRKTFLIAMLIFSAASVMNGAVTDLALFTFARAATGFGIFMMMVTSVAYIAEMSPGESRGKWQSLTASIGFCAIPFIGVLCRIIIPTSPDGWRTIFYLGGAGIVTFFLGLKYLKESPRWLVSKGRVAEVEAVVRELSGVDVDLSDVAKNTPPKVNVMEQFVGMFSGKYAKRSLILLGFGIPVNIAVFTLSGWLAIFSGMRGFSLEEAMNIQIAFSLGGPVGMFLSAPFSDKGGRKIPLAIAIFGEAVLALYYAYLGNGYMLSLIVAFGMNAFGMAHGFYAMSYVPEHFPTKMRNTSVGIINAIQRLSISFVQPLVPVFVAGYGVNALFLGVFALLTIGALEVFLLGQRTGGVPLEQIE